MDVSGLRFARYEDELQGATRDMFLHWYTYHFRRNDYGHAVAYEYSKWTNSASYEYFYPLTFFDLTSEETSLVLEWCLS